MIKVTGSAYEDINGLLLFFIEGATDDLHCFDWTNAVIRDHNIKVEIAIFGWCSIRLRAKEVYRIGMQACVAKAIIAFHPSGDPTPSQGDSILTYRLKGAGELMCIELLDNLNTGEESYISLRDAGLLKI